MTPLGPSVAFVGLPVGILTCAGAVRAGGLSGACAVLGLLVDAGIIAYLVSQ